MNIGEYERSAMSTAIFKERIIRMIDTLTREELIDLLCDVYATLGLLGEAGELANKLKKVIRDGEGRYTKESLEGMDAERGDVLWYLAVSASLSGTSLEQVASNNVEKLKARMNKGTIQGSGDSR